MSDNDIILQYLQSIEGKIDNMLDKLISHDTRIGDTEKWQSNADGKVTAIGVICVALGGIISWIVGLVKH